MNIPGEDCLRIRESLSDHFDGRLLPGDPFRLEVEAHLSACPACAAFLSDLALIREAVSPRGAELPDPEAFSRRLEARLSASARPRIRAWIPLASAAGLALAVGLLWRPKAQPPAPPVPAPASVEAPRPASPSPSPAPSSWRLLGETAPTSVAEIREAGELSELLEEVHCVRGSRRPLPREALFQEMASVRDLARSATALEEVAYAP